jgi:3-hydroxy acid dehydrogenase/malonic semialdehyde reductase
MKPKIALITGASSGIGNACATWFYDQGFKVLITGRRKDRLADFLVGKDPERVRTLCFDVRDKNQVFEALNELPPEEKKIDVLVNNAGLAWGLSAFFDGNIDHWEAMIDTNVKGLLYVSKTVTPWMIAENSGHVINIGSIAGKEVYANGNVYCATKHAVDALSKAMRIELAAYGIRVSVVHPGAVETEFSLVRFDGDEEKAAQVYQGFENLLAEDIADAVGYIATRKPHVNINEMIVMPQAQPIASIIHRK